MIKNRNLTAVTGRSGARKACWLEPPDDLDPLDEERVEVEPRPQPLLLRPPAAAPAPRPTPWPRRSEESGASREAERSEEPVLTMPLPATRSGVKLGCLASSDASDEWLVQQWPAAGVSE